MVELVVIIVLGLIIVAQIVERYLFAQTMLQQLSNAQKAVMSRNLNEYLAATTTPKGKDESFSKNEEVDISELSDEKFEEYITKQNQ